MLTIENFKKILYNYVITHNLTYMKNYPLTHDMIAKKVQPIPSALWQYSETTYGALRSITNKDQYLYALLQPVTAKLSRKCIIYKDLYYMDFSEWGLLQRMYAQGSKSTPIEMRIDPRNVGALYILDDSDRLKEIPLNIERTGNNYEGMTLAEYLSLRKSKKEQDKLGGIHNEELRVGLLAANENVIAIAAENALHYANAKNLRMVRAIEKNIEATKIAACKEFISTPVPLADTKDTPKVIHDHKPLNIPMTVDEAFDLFEEADYLRKIYKEHFDYISLADNERQYDDIDSKTSLSVDAAYVKSIIPEDNGNRFIEALPRPRSVEEVKLVYNKPLLTYDFETEHALHSEQRELMVYRLRDVRFPLPYQARLEQVVYNSLCLSYRARYRAEDDEIGFDIDLGNGVEKGHCKLLGDSSSAANAGFALLGYSGSGKSSTLHTLLSNYPQVIFHYIKGYRVPQIVYLVVNCVPNSNFVALYVGIGNAIDRALGLDYVYEKMISRLKSLGDKAEKVRQLVEQFSVGRIIFDKIQLIDSSSTKENSFESLMVLTNRTKVAIGIVGTTDAYSKMFTSMRTARRVGTLISACQYCENKDYFKFLVQNLMRYQWFDSIVDPTQEIVDALCDNTHGIIDQLISLYICMHIEYLSKKRKPKMD